MTSQTPSGNSSVKGEIPPWSADIEKAWQTGIRDIGEDRLEEMAEEITDTVLQSWVMSDDEAERYLPGMVRLYQRFLGTDDIDRQTFQELDEGRQDVEEKIRSSEQDVQSFREEYGDDLQTVVREHLERASERIDEDPEWLGLKAVQLFGDEKDRFDEEEMEELGAVPDKFDADTDNIDAIRRELGESVKERYSRQQRLDIRAELNEGDFELAVWYLVENEIVHRGGRNWDIDRVRRECHDIYDPGEMPESLIRYMEGITDHVSKTVVEYMRETAAEHLFGRPKLREDEFYSGEN